MAINILVIDDDVRVVERLMNGLKRADTEHIIGIIKVDGSITKIEHIEDYEPETQYGTQFDLVLIDYQLGCSFTGMLVSAWIALIMNVPRLTLTTAQYPGKDSYFDGFILKKEITDEPTKVIEKILNAIEEYDASKWLEKQHSLLVREYQRLLYRDEAEGARSIEQLLDKYERILDAKQETQVHLISSFVENDEIKDKIAKNEENYNSLMHQLDKLLEELKND